ncbi:DUF983 domain-containing protein [Algoriphagus namhaensis]
MMSKPSKLGAILGAKCPQCRQGSLFPVSIFSFRRLIAVNHYCPNCKANFQPEPDFFYGAMYISYAFSVALVIASLVAMNVLFDEPELWMYITTVIVSNALLFPAMLRYSKVLYLYLVGKLRYREDKV